MWGLGAIAGAGILGAGALGCAATGLAILVQPTWLVRIVQRRVPSVAFLMEKPARPLLVALTIDDAPHESVTPELLDILKENECRATWFLIGSNMDQCPSLVERIHSEGHEVGNHTMHDVASWRLHPAELLDQLLATERRLEPYFWKDNDGKPIKWFRPGHGFYTQKMLEVVNSCGYKLALGSLFPVDTLFTNQGRRIAQYLLWRIHSGAIVILHDRGPQKVQTAEVLRNLLPELKSRGYSIVTLSELLECPVASSR